MLGFWRQKKQESEELGYTYYRMIVQQVRKEWFYKDLQVDDTPFGRFEVMTIHLFLFLRRLKQEKNSLAQEISQKISDFFVIDLDESLRELRLGESKIARQFNKFIQGFYGRLIAYDQAFEENNTALKKVIQRNLYVGEVSKESQVEAVADYIRRQAVFLQQQELTTLQFRDVY